MDNFSISVSGKSSILTHNFDQEQQLNGDYELALTLLETYNTISNVNSTNNKFEFGEKIITIDEGCYEISDIIDFLNKKINPDKFKKIDKILDELESTFHSSKKEVIIADDQEKQNDIITFRENHNTFKVEIYCEQEIHFDKPNSIGSLLGFSAKKLKAREWHYSDRHINIFDVDTFFVTTNITGNAWHNSKKNHAIYQTCLNSPPSHKLSIQPSNLIYYPIICRNLNEIVFKIVDEHGRLVSFRGERITIAVHIKRKKNAAHFQSFL